MRPLSLLLAAGLLAAAAPIPAHASLGQLGDRATYCFEPGGFYWGPHPLLGHHNLDHGGWNVALETSVPPVAGEEQYLNPNGELYHPTATVTINGGNVNILTADPDSGVSYNTGNMTFYGEPWRFTGQDIDMRSAVMVIWVGPDKEIMDAFCGGRYYAANGTIKPASTADWEPRYIWADVPTEQRHYILNPAFTESTTPPSNGGGGGSSSSR